MSAHTPGPWGAYSAEHLSKGDEDPALFFTVGPRPFHTVAEVRPGNVGEGLPEQTPANARLIAAAPDLLEALKEVRRFLDHGEPVRIAASAHDRQLMELVDAAIAKAEGRAE